MIRTQLKYLQSVFPSDMRRWIWESKVKQRSVKYNYTVTQIHYTPEIKKNINSGIKSALKWRGMKQFIKIEKEN